jgi:phage-related protein
MMAKDNLKKNFVDFASRYKFTFIWTILFIIVLVVLGSHLELIEYYYYSKEKTVSIVIFIIVLLFFASSVFLVMDFDKIRHQLNKFTNCFQNKERLANDYETIKNGIKEISYINDLWQEFDETLLISRDIRYNDVYEDFIKKLKKYFEEKCEDPLFNETIKEEIKKIISSEDIQEMKKSNLSYFIWEQLLTILKDGFPDNQESAEKLGDVIRSYKHKIKTNKNETQNNLEQFKDIIKECPNILDVWENYLEIINNHKELPKKFAPTTVLNTAQIEEYINYHTVIEKQTHIRFFEAMPGIFTGLGLLGTFLAILFALSHFSTAPDKIGDSVGTLLNGLSFKFASSLTGIGAALIFIIIKRGGGSILENKLHKIQNTINGLLTRRTSEALLNDMLAELRQQTRDIKEFLTDLDFTNAIKKAFETGLKEDLEPKLSEIQSILEESNNLSENNKNQLLQVLDKEIKKGLKDIASQNQKSTSQIISSIQGSLSDIVKQKMDAINSNINSLTQSNKDLKDAINVIYYDYLKHQLEDLKSNLQSNLSSSITEAIKNSMQDITRSFENAISEMNQMVGELKNLKQESSAALIETLINEMKSSMKEMMVSIQEAMLGGTDGAVKDLAQTLENTSSCLTEMQGTFENLIIRLEDRFKQSESERDEAMQIVITSILEKLSGFMEELNYKISNLVEVMSSNDNERQSKLVESVEIISQSVEKLLYEIDNSGSRSKEQTEQTINTIKDQAESLQLNISDSLRGNLQQIVNKVNELMDRINSTSTEVNNTSRHTVESISASCHAVIDNANRVMDTQNYKLTEWSNLIKSYIDQVKDDQNDLQERFSKIINDLNQTLEYQSAVTEDSNNLVSLLNDSSKQITNASNQLNSALNKLSNFMDQTNKTQTEVNNLFNNFNGLNTDLEAKLKQNIQLWQTEKQVFGQLETTINNLIEKLADATKNFGETTKSTHEEFYRKYSESINNELGSLNTITLLLKESIEDFIDSQDYSRN